jgi:hypothetical protein
VNILKLPSFVFLWQVSDVQKAKLKQLEEWNESAVRSDLNIDEAGTETEGSSALLFMPISCSFSVLFFFEIFLYFRILVIEYFLFFFCTWHTLRSACDYNIWQTQNSRVPNARKTRPSTTKSRRGRATNP